MQFKLWLEAAIQAMRGDDAPIETFDPKKIRRAEYGTGFYFTNDDDVAMRFGPIVTDYLLHLDNPFEIQQFQLTKTIASMTNKKIPKTLKEKGDWITETLMEKEHDGIIINLAANGIFGPITYYVVLDPAKIEKYNRPPPQEQPTQIVKPIKATLGKPRPA